MIDKNNIFIVFDISSTKVTGLVATKTEDNNHIKILSHHISLHRAIQKGSIIDADNLVTALTDVKDKIEDDIGLKVKQTNVITNTPQMQFVPVRGAASVSGKNSMVSPEDVNKAKEMSTHFRLDHEQIIVSTDIKEYILDGQSGIINPIGMKGGKLELIGHHIVLSHQIVKDLELVFSRLGIEILEISSSIIALSYLILSTNSKISQGVINIGSDTTGIAIIHDNALSYAKIIPIGSLNIDKDLAYGLNISLEQAKQIKEQYGLARKPMAKDKTSITINDDAMGPKKFMRSLVDNIIYYRALEISNVLKDQLKTYIDLSDLIGGIILSGGGARLKAMPELLRSILNLDINKDIVSSKIADNFNLLEQTAFYPSIGYALKYYFSSYQSKRLNPSHSKTPITAISNMASFFKKLF